MSTTDLLLALLFALVAMLYGSVGHGGASGYLAMMALVGLPASVMRPTALVLNLFVSAIVGWRFGKAGFFSWSLFWPFALGSIPFAFLGGTLSISTQVYKTLVAIALFAAALRLLIESRRAADLPTRKRPWLGAVLIGAGLGLLSGVTGVGGGIYLSPLLLFMHWATTKQTAGIAAAFIFVNSAAGLAGNLASVHGIPSAIPLWIAAVLVGGFIGSSLGSNRFSRPMFRRMLAFVLFVAVWKLLDPLTLFVRR